jgi:hypothetical protein
MEVVEMMVVDSRRVQSDRQRSKFIALREYNRLKDVLRIETPSSFMHGLNLQHLK